MPNDIAHMNARQHRVAPHRALLAGALFAVFCLPGIGQSRIIESVRAVTDADWPEIFIRLASPMHYITHVPRSKGDVLSIRLRPVSRPNTSEDMLTGHEALSWRASSRIPLASVSYEGSALGMPSLFLQFKRQVRFQVRQGADKNTIVVTILPMAKTPPKPRTAPIRKARTRLASAPPATDNMLLYVVNLASSPEPIELENVPRTGEIARHRLYTTRAENEGKVWYRLRLGFFTSPQAAEGVMNKVRDRYPDAWIGLAMEEDKLIYNAVARRPGPSTPEASPQRAAEPQAVREARGSIDPAHRYVINLESSRRPISGRSPPQIDSREPYLIYSTRAKVDGRTWHRLRLGFFASQKEAERVRQTLREHYPRAWIGKASRSEIAQAAAGSGLKLRTPARFVQDTRLAAVPITSRHPRKSGDLPNEGTTPGRSPVKPGMTQAGTTAAARPPGRTSGADEDKLAQLMEQARQAMAKGDYSRAVAIYNKVLQSPDNPYQRDAQEFIALGRERKGQLAHAKAEYTKYLKMYPEGEGAERVRQRLTGLVTARKSPRKRLRQAKADTSRWDYYGGISQFYRRFVNVFDDEGEVVSESSLATDLDLTARRRGEAWDFNSRFTGGYRRDFLDSDHENETRISSVFFDVSDGSKVFFTRIGRQTRNTGGVLGRFDGAHLSYQLTDWSTANMVSGFPVDSTRDGLHTEHYFYGASIDLGTFAEAWDFTGYAIQQTTEGFTDRRAVGAEVRHFRPGRSLFTQVDYDIHFGELNNFIALGNWTFPNKVSLNATADYRKSPSLSTLNALQGQLARTLDELRQGLSDKEIYQLAKDRTSTSRTYTLGAAYPLSERFQLTGDATMTNLTDTPASGGVDAIPGTGNDYFYSLQLTGSSLFKAGDVSILQLRYSDTGDANTTSFLVNSRYPVTRQFRVNPRVRVNYRRNTDDDSTQWIIAPRLRLDYRVLRRYRFEI
jgi:tetratricopeptide (TPR) repeat protein